MSLTARIARNTIVQLIGKVFSVFFGIAAVSIMTRYLSPSGYGQYYIVVTFVAFFGTLADLGLYIVSVKRISEQGVDMNRLFSNIFTLRIASALVFVVLAPVVVLFFPYPAYIKEGVAAISITNLFVVLTQIFTGVFQKELAMTRASLAEIFGKLAMLLLVVFCVVTRQSLPLFFFATVASSFVQCLFLFFYVRRYVRFGFAFDWEVWMSLLHQSWPVALSVALNLIYFRADAIILSLFHSQATVGLYGAGYKVLEVLIAFPAMFAGLVMPIVSFHASSGDHERFSQAVQKGFDFMVTLALPIVAGVFVLAHPIMTIVAGGKFTSAGSILRVLVFAVGIIFVGTFFGNTVVAVNQQKKMMKYYLYVAIFALAGYLFLIPRFSVWGASGMTVATELAITLSSIFVVRKAIHFNLAMAQFMKVLIASAVMGVVVYMLRHDSLLVGVLVGFVTYPVVLGAVGGLQRDMIREIIRRQ